MPEKPKQQPKKPTVESLKTQKTSIAKDYKKFENIKDRYTTDEGLIQSLGVTKDLWQKISKKPKFAAIVDKVKSLAFNGLSALMAIKGISISQEANLIKIKEKLKGLKNKLQETYKNWLTRNGELVRLADVERKRFELISSTNVNSLDKIVIELVAIMLSGKKIMADSDIFKGYLQNIIKSNPLYLNLRKKIEKASNDEILHMYNDPTRFTDFEKDMDTLVIAEFKRLQLLEYVREHAKDVAETMIRLKRTEEEIYTTHQEILASDEYNNLIQKINTATYKDLVKMDKDEYFFQKPVENFQLIGYRYLNTKRLDNQLTPYLELKPKAISETEFLATLQNNKIYKTALAKINSGNLTTQESFDPKQYINFDKEKGTKQPRGKAPENMYQFAAFAAQIVPNNSFANEKINKDFDTA